MCVSQSKSFIAHVLNEGLCGPELHIGKVTLRALGTKLRSDNTFSSFLSAQCSEFPM